jgi:hypothetical protein
VSQNTAVAVRGRRKKSGRVKVICMELKIGDSPPHKFCEFASSARLIKEESECSL